MNKIYLIIIILICGTWKIQASPIVTPKIWANGDSVTAALLNGNQTAITSVVNGGLDNTNIGTGFHLYEILSALPTAGTQGRTVYNTSDNTLNTDTGSAWQTTVTPTGSLATGQLPYYSSGWKLLNPGTQHYSLVSNGTSSNPSYQQVNLANGVTSTLAIANGGTGQTSATNAINALLPTQSGNSGKFLTTNGTSASWGTPALTLVSATSFSAGITTGSIAINSTDMYLVRIMINSISLSSSFGIRFNGDTGSNYLYAYRSLTTGGVAANGNSASNGLIVFGPNITASTAEPTNISFVIYPQGTTTAKDSNVKGDIIYPNAMTDFMGTWQGSTNRTSFSVDSVSGSATLDGIVYLYKYSLS